MTDLSLAGETDWVSAHLFHQGDLDRLLDLLVRPLVTDLAAGGLACDWFFLRYWDGGPHVRLRVLPVDAGDAAAVRDRIRRAADAYFAAHPSDRATPPADYARLAAEFAGLEGAADYAREMAPSDTIAFAPYRREHDRYGVGAAMAAVERHFVTSSRIALDLVAAGPTADQRSTVAFSFVLLAWLSVDRGRLSVPWPAAPSPGGGPWPAGVDVSRQPRPKRERRFHGLPRAGLARAGRRVIVCAGSPGERWIGPERSPGAAGATGRPRRRSAPADRAALTLPAPRSGRVPGRPAAAPGRRRSWVPWHPL